MPRLFHPAAATAAMLASMLLASSTFVQATTKTQNMRGSAVTSTGKPRGTNIFKGKEGGKERGYGIGGGRGGLLRVRCQRDP
eukprot:evm.model.NODE_31970_length_4428_cov_37.010387.1